MSARVHVREDYVRDALEFFIIEDSTNGRAQFFADGTVEWHPLDEVAAMTEPRASLTLREDHARALLQALLRHYQGGDDLRALRKDYDAERARVDRLIGAFIPEVSR